MTTLSQTELLFIHQYINQQIQILNQQLINDILNLNQSFADDSLLLYCVLISDLQPTYSLQYLQFLKIKVDIAFKLYETLENRYHHPPQQIFDRFRYCIGLYVWNQKILSRFVMDNIPIPNPPDQIKLLFSSIILDLYRQRFDFHRTLSLAEVTLLRNFLQIYSIQPSFNEKLQLISTTINLFRDKPQIQNTLQNIYNLFNERYIRNRQEPLVQRNSRIQIRRRNTNV